MEAYGGRAPETFSDPVPDMVKQFVVYLYRHIRYADQVVWFETMPCAHVFLITVSEMHHVASIQIANIGAAESAISERSFLCTTCLLPS